MKKVRWKITVILVAAALCGCVNDPTENGVAEDLDTGSRKVLTAPNAVNGELLVKFSDEAIAAVESGVTRSGATRTGIQPFDAALNTLGAISMKRVFPYVEKDEADARAFGLHRWYKIRFNPEISLDKASSQLAAFGEVSVVQYNTHMLQNFEEEKVVPYDQVWAAERDQLNTRSDETSKFNDPMLNKQWHYKNTGDENLVTPIKAGCDINLEPAWELCAGDPSIIVAVVDQPVIYTHSDLKANMWINEKELNGEEGVDDDGNGYVDDIYGFNFISEYSATTGESKYIGEIQWDDDSNAKVHGTHVAGTISAVNNNGVGVCGVAGGTGNNDGVKLMSIQIHGSMSSATTEGTAAGIKYAADNGASILQCSWGEPNEKVTTEEEYLKKFGVQADAINYFISKPRPGSPLNGGIAIVSAGNDSYGRCSFPGGYSKVVCVTSMGTDFTPSVFTNFGDAADITAPGGDSYYHNNDAGGVLSTVQIGKHFDGYAYMSGTSMSTPHVSGVAALALSYAKQLGKMFEPDEFRDMLLSAVNDIDSYLHGIKTYEPQGMVYNGKLDMDERRGKMGTGMIDAYKMLMAVRGTPAVTVEQKKATKISLGKYYGDIARLTYKLRVSDDVAGKLGLTCTTGEDGTVEIICTKQGAGLVYVETSNGGIDMSRELAIVCRAKAASNGGWL